MLKNVHYCGLALSEITNQDLGDHPDKDHLTETVQRSARVEGFLRLTKVVPRAVTLDGSISFYPGPAGAPPCVTQGPLEFVEDDLGLRGSHDSPPTLRKGQPHCCYSIKSSSFLISEITKSAPSLSNFSA